MPKTEITVTPRYPSPTEVRARIEAARTHALDELRANTRLALRSMQDYTTSLAVPHGTHRADAEAVVAELRSGDDPWDAELHWVCGPISFISNPAALILRIPAEDALLDDAESRAADGDGWQTEGLPPLGAWVDVRVETGEVYTGEVVEVSNDGAVVLRGQASCPARYRTGNTMRWYTWADSNEHWPQDHRTGWRLAKRPTRDTVTMAYTVDGQEREVSVTLTPAEPDAERLPDGRDDDVTDDPWALGEEPPKRKRVKAKAAGLGWG